MTLLDLQHLDLPRMFSRSERAFRTVAWHRSVRGGRPRDHDQRVRPRPRGASARPRPGARARRSTSGSTTTLLPPGAGVEREPFLLYPARRWPHKNHERLFEAFALVRRERPELRLVLTGGGHDGAGLPDGVDVLGAGAVDELVGLDAARLRARLPVALRGLRPAAARGDGVRLPGRAARTPASLPEVVGDAARLFDPHDAEAIADAVLDVLAAPAEWVGARPRAGEALLVGRDGARDTTPSTRELL